MKDCNGRPVGLNDVVATGWCGGDIVTGKVIAVAPNGCRVLIEEPHAANKKVRRHSSQVALVEKAHGPL